MIKYIKYRNLYKVKEIRKQVEIVISISVTFCIISIIFGAFNRILINLLSHLFILAPSILHIVYSIGTLYNTDAVYVYDPAEEHWDTF